MTWREAADAAWFGPVVSAARRAVNEAALAILPSRCVGCSSDAGPLCVECGSDLGRALLHPSEVDDLRELDVLAPQHRAPVVAAAAYSGVVSNALLAAKTRGGLGLIRRFGPAVDRAWKLMRSATERGPVAVVPVPSKAASVRARGFSPVEELLRVSGVQPVMNFLKVRTLTSWGLTRQGPQKSRGRSGRSAAVKGQFTIDQGALQNTKRRDRLGRIPRRVVLFDDVMTTGSTLAEAARTLRSHGFTVVGAFCVAWVRPPGGTATVSASTVSASEEAENKPPA